MAAPGYPDLDETAQVEALRPVAIDGAARLGLEPVTTLLAHHGYNTTFQVTTADGSEYAVRVLTNSASTPQHLEAQHAWMHALGRERAIAVPDPVRGPDGATYAVVPNSVLGRDAVVVAATWLPGPDVRTPTKEQAHELGVAMALLHEHSEDWSLPEGTMLPTFDEPLFGDPDLISRAPLPRESAAVITEALDRCRAAFAADHGAVMPIHADLHGGNLKWYARRLAVFDFDDSGFGTAALDLAISTFYLRDTVDGAEVAMRHGYQAMRTLPELDSAVFEALIAARQLLLANALLTTHTASLRAEAADYLVTTVARLEHWIRTGRFTRAV